MNPPSDAPLLPKALGCFCAPKADRHEVFVSSRSDISEKWLQEFLSVCHQITEQMTSFIRPLLIFPLPAEAAACPSCAIPAAQGGWGQESRHPAASQTRSDLMRFVFRTVKSEACIKNTNHPNLIKNLSCRSDHILKTTASSACEIRLVIGISEVMLP